MTGQAVADNPGLVSHVWFFGSAGVTEQTGDALADQIASGQTSVNATHADADSIAEWGRKVAGERTPRGSARGAGRVLIQFERGRRARVRLGAGRVRRGHRQSRHGEQREGRARRLDRGTRRRAHPRYESVEQTGYLDPSAQSFKQFVVGLREALETAGAN